MAARWPRSTLELTAQVLDGGRQLLRVTAAPGELHLAEHRAGVAERDRHLRGRGVDREHQHRSASDDRGDQRVARARLHATPAASSAHRRVSSSSSPSCEQHVEPVARAAAALDPVAPLDDGHRLARRRGRRTRGRAAPAGGRGGRRRRARAASGASYSRTTVNVGLTTGSVMPSATAMPLANTVLPAPSSPSSTTTSPARSSAPTRAGRARASRRRRASSPTAVIGCVPRASARLTTTKSARAWASAVPPLRNTADGWNAGIEHRAVAERELAARAAW